jgi:hypothetical protein
MTFITHRSEHTAKFHPIYVSDAFVVVVAADDYDSHTTDTVITIIMSLVKKISYNIRTSSTHYI